MLISSDSQTRCWAVLATSLACSALMAPNATAAPTTTEGVAEVGDFLMTKATCGDFNKALSTHGKAEQTAEENIMVALAMMYIEGFAAGAGNDSRKRADVIIRCTMNPSDKFNTVVPGQ